MIEFQDIFEETTALEKKVGEQIKLLRALANFHVKEDSTAECEDLLNQRQQIVKSLKEMEKIFEKLVESWNDSVEELKSAIAYSPEADDYSDLITKFINIAVPPEMQIIWRPKDFTGSLHVFFVDGKIDSSSLIEKKPRPTTEHINETGPPTNEVVSEKPVTVVNKPKESFTIMKTPFSPEISIHYSVPKAVTVVINIYNQLDQLIRCFEKRHDRAGDYSVVWDGRDDEGNLLPKGTYYCQLQIGDTNSETKPIVLS
ncbi:MAG: FlgD immunoglobulin-like domain containing protein [bacterium]